MICPRCGHQHCQIIMETTTKTKGFGVCKACIGYLLFNVIGVLCGLCGMGKSKSRTESFWVCNNCGNKFKA